MAYSDTRYKTEYEGEGRNLGWTYTYRNDGVDITSNSDTDSKSIGYHVFETEASEWLKYNVDVRSLICGIPSCFENKNGSSSAAAHPSMASSPAKEVAEISCLQT